MSSKTRWLTVVWSVAPLLAADPAGFGLWHKAELEQREQALSKAVRPDHSARETLADYRNRRFRLLYREGDGYPEQHDNEVDVVIVERGEGTLLLGGKLIAPVMNPEANQGVGEWTGTRIEGGSRHLLSAGDVVHIPAKVPHAFLVSNGKHITYVLLKLPAR